MVEGAFECWLNLVDLLASSRAEVLKIFGTFYLTKKLMPNVAGSFVLWWVAFRVESPGLIPTLPLHFPPPHLQWEESGGLIP